MKKFSKTLHGYNPKEVADFFDEVIVQVQKIVKKSEAKDEIIANLQKENEVLHEQIDRYKAMEMTMNQTIVAAQNSGEQIRRIAKQEGDMIISEARSNANRIISDALLRAEKTEFESARLRKNISISKRKLHDDVQTVLEMIDNIEILDI